MNIIAQFNFFFQKHLEHNFTPNETAVYMQLLHICNALGRKNPFNYAKARLMMDCNMKSEDRFDTARERLRKAGLIEFQNGQGKGKTTVYMLTVAPRGLLQESEAEQETLTDKGAKSPPLSPPLSAPETPEEKGADKGAKNTPLSKKSGQKKAEKGADKGVKNTPQTGGTTIKKRKELTTECVELSEGLRWVGENAPEVQRLKTALTADQWEKLVADFGRPTVEEVLLAMQNHAGLTRKYTSANLTARTWCQRRRPAGSVPSTPPPASRPAPDLNHELIAEQQAADAAALQARLNRYATT